MLQHNITRVYGDAVVNRPTVLPVVQKDSSICDRVQYTNLMMINNDVTGLQFGLPYCLSLF